MSSLLVSPRAPLGVGAARSRSPSSAPSLALAFAVSLFLGACGGSSPEAGPAEAASAHGVVGAAPGSHADWCGEHAVPESQCTRCDSSLIPAFQATGDWCAEHSVPESQCLQCSPGLKIERPPKDG